MKNLFIFCILTLLFCETLFAFEVELHLDSETPAPFANEFDPIFNLDCDSYYYGELTKEGEHICYIQVLYDEDNASSLFIHEKSVNKSSVILFQRLLKKDKVEELMHQMLNFRKESTSLEEFNEKVIHYYVYDEKVLAGYEYAHGEQIVGNNHLIYVLRFRPIALWY